MVGVTQGRIAQILLETAELPKLTKSTIASGIPHLEVAEHSPLMRLGETLAQRRFCLLYTSDAADE